MRGTIITLVAVLLVMGVAFAASTNVSAKITVEKCAQTVMGKIIVGVGCREYNVTITPPDTDYNLVVLNAAGDTIKTFAGRGNQIFKVTWPLNPTIGEPIEDLIPNCAEVVIGDNIVSKTCDIPESTPEYNVSVEISSPYPYDYKIVGKKILLTLYVDYTARNSCYGMYTRVKEGNCEGCYTVEVVERTPAKNEVCAQVIRPIRSVTASIPIPPNVKKVKIDVVKTTITGPAIPTECISIEGEISRLAEMIQGNCGGSGCDVRILEEYNRIAARYKEICGNTPPKIRPPTPKIPEKPKIILPVKLKIPGMEIKEVNGSIIVKGRHIEAVIKAKIQEEDGRIVVGGKPVDLNVDAIYEKIKRHVGGEVKKLTLQEEGGNPVYVAESEQRGRLLGIIPINVRAQVIVSAENGEIISVKKPWWAFLIWG